MKYPFSLFLFLSTLSSYAQTEIPIYSGAIPNAIPCSLRNDSFVNATGVTLSSNIVTPTLSIYLPQKQNEAKSAILILPGGGYAYLATNHEGVAIAKAFNEIGVTAFVLKYRMPNDSCMSNKETVPLMDAQQSMKYIRDHAKEYGINQNKVGVIGFSAGGHLASTLITKFNLNLLKTTTNLRPDFAILAYPVISMEDSLVHMGSRNKLLGLNPTQERIAYFSSNLQVTTNTPPTFIFHAKDDKTVPVMNSIQMKEALDAKKVRAQLLLMKTGNHGFGLGNAKTTVHWFPIAIDWLKEQSLMK
ncbi:MAG: hypothetical protein B7Y37_07415 [Sphingobacteriia bacterium 28-36-52]|nr:MAG: hypothetical protein B7Y37_07415 [Sphingobacteriia bacterium 28-36-52]